MSVALFTERAKAEPVQKRLIEAGFLAEIHEHPSLGALWFTTRHSGAVRLEVPAEQLERAEQFLLDWADAENALRDAIRCPECKSLRVEYPQYAEHSLLTNLAVGASAELGLVEKDYYCMDCHCTWPKPGASPRPREHTGPNYFLEDVGQTQQRR